ncbi:MAG: uridine diphosphate-N-acetylglucosamine-binding protein YvcK [Synergistaceae bacterium]|nr:uridine diphosphate-N-acetylglucosamine-binding protein YvcK [Synergistaceae bacterium]
MTSESWGALGFILGVFTTLFLVVVFDIRLFRRRKGESDPFRGAIARRLAMGPSIVAVGGGTGLSTLLKGLKGFTRNITAVVAVTDEGGSSGRLRDEWGVLPPGDVRNCMVALAENDNALKRILDFRFDRGELAGHSLGNLLLLAVSELCGDFRVAVEQMNHLLAIRGRVLPVTTEDIILFGQTRDGRRVKGELDISRWGRDLKEIWVEPQDAHPLPDVLRAADDADIILLGPGSLFTSVIPNLLLPEFAKKLRDAPAPKVYICNLMTQPEETEGMNLVQHIEWVSAALGAAPDCVVVNSDPIPDDIVAAYEEQGAVPLYLDRHQREAIQDMGCICIEAPTALALGEGGKRYLRHDPQKLASIVFRICRHMGVDPFEEGGG